MKIDQTLIFNMIETFDSTRIKVIKRSKILMINSILIDTQNSNSLFSNLRVRLNK